MTACPRCGCKELRIHGLIQEARFERRFGWFGEPRLTIRTRAADCSCSACYTTFTVRESGATMTADQGAHEAWKARRDGTGHEKGPSERADNPPVPRAPRAAPDPRVKRR